MRRGATGAAAGLLCTVLLAGVLAACDPGGGPGPTDDPSNGSSGGSTAEMPTEISSALVECDERVKGLQSAPQDLSGWSVVGPDGYHRDDSGVHFAPIEGDFDDAYFNNDVTDWPNQVGLNYFGQLEQGPVTNSCGQLVPELVVARIELQASEGGATILAGPDETEVAGLPAWVATFDYPSYDVGNRNYFVYGTHELIHIECQWDAAHEDEVIEACDFFLANMHLA